MTNLEPNLRDKLNRIDTVLTYLNHDKKPSETFVNVRDALGIKADDDSKYKSLAAIIDKLIKDGYLTLSYAEQGGVQVIKPSYELYSISYDGMLFIEDGGYTQKFIDDINTRIKTERYAKVASRNDTILSVGTIALAIGTFFLAFIEILKWYCGD